MTEGDIMKDKIISYLVYSFSIIAAIIFILALWNEILIMFGWKISFVRLGLGRMLELSAIFVVFVIALQLKVIINHLGLKDKNL